MATSQVADCGPSVAHDAAQSGGTNNLRDILMQNKQYLDLFNAADSSQKRTPVMMAAAAGHHDCVKVLAANGVPLETEDFKKQTALFLACHSASEESDKHLQCVKTLLEYGADPNGSINHLSSPLYLASQHGKLDIVKELVKHGAILNAMARTVSGQKSGTAVYNEFGLRQRSSLYIAMTYNRLDTFKYLLIAGADPDWTVAKYSSSETDTPDSSATSTDSEHHPSMRTSTRALPSSSGAPAAPPLPPVPVTSQVAPDTHLALYQISLKTSSPADCVLMLHEVGAKYSVSDYQHLHSQQSGQALQQALQQALLVLDCPRQLAQCCRITIRKHIMDKLNRNAPLRSQQGHCGVRTEIPLVACLEQLPLPAQVKQYLQFHDDLTNL